MEKELDLAAVIGFKGKVVDGLILHPDNEHLLYHWEQQLLSDTSFQEPSSF